MNSFDFVLKVFLFIAPIFYWADWPLAKAQLQFFQLGTIFLFLVALSQKQQRRFRDRTLFALGIVCFSNVFISPTPYCKVALTNIVFGLMLYYLIVCYTKNLRCIFKTLIVLSVVNVVLALSQKFGFNFVFDPVRTPPAFFGAPSFHGDFQALILPLAVYLHPVLIIFPVIGLVLSKSATACLAGVVGLGFVLVRKKFGMIYLLSLLSASLIFILHFKELLLYKLQVRFMIWEKILTFIFDRPFRGWGLGSVNGFAKELTFDKLGTADRIYNDFLEFGLCTGVIGLIFLGLFVFNKIKRYSRANKSSLLDTVFATCLVASVLCLSHSPMAPLFSTIGMSPRIAVVIITMLAMLEISLQKGENNGFN